MRAITEDLSELPLVLKGWTALLLCYELDRFSEDLDFDGRKKLNVVNRISRVLAKQTSSFDLRIVKDTDTVQRLKIRYETSVGPGALKIEISYRGNFENNEFAHIDGVKTYPTERLIEQKLAALAGRTAARDLYDVAFLVNRYASAFTPSASASLQLTVQNLNALESRFRIAFETDDIFAERVNVADVIVRLHEAAKAMR